VEQNQQYTFEQRILARAVAGALFIALALSSRRWLT
jgi:hypothetical protein